MSFDAAGLNGGFGGGSDRALSLLELVERCESGKAFWSLRPSGSLWPSGERCGPDGPRCDAGLKRLLKKSIVAQEVSLGG